MKMELLLKRFTSDAQSTLGILHINNVKECFTLEDEKRTVKVPGETRIPAGRYEVKFRKVDSGLTLRYRKRFPEWFTYHLELQGVPNFQYVYIHIGNTEKDSDGCILVGKGYKINNNAADTISNSTAAFTDVYKKISAALGRGEKVFITVKDE